MPWYVKFDGVDGSIDSTAPVLQPELTTEPTAAAMGDFDNNGDVDGRDFLAWQRGTTASTDDQDFQDIVTDQSVEVLGQPVTETVTEKFTITVETVHF